MIKRRIFQAYRTVSHQYTWDYTESARADSLYDLNDNQFAIILYHNDIDDDTGPSATLRYSNYYTCSLVSKTDFKFTRILTASEKELLLADMRKHLACPLAQACSGILTKDGRVYVLDGHLLLNDFTQESVEINFGKSNWAWAQKDPYSIPENILTIPITQALPAGEWKLLNPIYAFPEESNEPKTKITIPAESNEPGVSFEVLLFWIKEREEWIAVHKKSWNECGPTDESFEGPFAISQEYDRAILQANGISCIAKNLSPERLMSISQTGIF